MDRKKRQEIRYLVKIREDYQKMRIATDNRLSKKADDSDQSKLSIDYEGIDALDLVDIKEATKDIEKQLDKKIAKALKGVPVYEQFLKNVKGLGPSLSAVLISEIDIEKASTVSKIWQYAGLNPAMVFGKKKEGDKIIQTTDLIKGDRKTKGYMMPYNGFLKSKLLGVMADCFIKARSPYTEYYYNYKARLEQSEKPVNGDTSKHWKDETPAHRNNAAKRYMIKMFLIDLYRNWRKIDGYCVRNLYQEEYLGHKHEEAI